jgi:hypothetical protein
LKSAKQTRTKRVQPGLSLDINFSKSQINKKAITEERETNPDLKDMRPELYKTPVRSMGGS